jgi:Uma2 family endonuclease
MSTQAIPHLTPEQYLEIERAAETRSEYLAGLMYAMSGSSFHHAILVANTGTDLTRQLHGRDCLALIADIRLYVKRHDLITYPDVFVICGTSQFHDKRKDTLIDATFIVEILSPSTKNYDRREKFRFYRALPSLREYLLIAQDEVRAEHHVRQPDGSWLMREYGSRSDEIEIKAIGCRLRLETLYERVQFEATSN